MAIVAAAAGHQKFPLPLPSGLRDYFASPNLIIAKKVLALFSSDVSCLVWLPSAPTPLKGLSFLSVCSQGGGEGGKPLAGRLPC